MYSKSLKLHCSQLEKLIIVTLKQLYSHDCKVVIVMTIQHHTTQRVNVLNYLNYLNLQSLVSRIRL